MQTTNSHTKLLAPNDLISLSYRTQDCVRNDNVYYELKIKIRLKYFSATRPVLEDFLGFLKVSLSRHNKKLSFESGEEQIKGYGKVTQNTEIFSTKYGNNILEVGSPAFVKMTSLRHRKEAMYLKREPCWKNSMMWIWTLISCWKVCQNLLGPLINIVYYSCLVKKRLIMGLW